MIEKKQRFRSSKCAPYAREEYDDPLNRRFHAQTNACPSCGPQVELIKNSSNLLITTKIGGKGNGGADSCVCPSTSGDTNSIRANFQGNDAIMETIRLLKHGKIVAIKGLGGFHLAVMQKSRSNLQIVQHC